MERTTLHIVGGDSRSRAEQARIAFALGHHAEVYADLGELLERPTGDGIVIAADDERPDAARRLIRELGGRGCWMPVVLTAPVPDVERVVAAVKAGALDYLALPLEMASFARRLEGILAEAGEHAGRRRREVEAQHAVSLLSRREREVLELLSAGCSNKEIARNLAISPRTVEIHRGNMMTKLAAGHAADAVRLWLDAQQGPALAPPGDDRRDAHRDAAISGRIGDRRGVSRARLAARRQRQ
ncbi:MAG TPA: LuxR C-terminal-related transcriptional regulator [Croceibacterium sp.]|nr:LuxR C-terminal-related transcriptional regulator [Croceibacterium sp.]